MTPKERLWKAVYGQLEWASIDEGVISVPTDDLRKVLQQLGELEDRIYYAVGTLNGNP